MRCPDAISSNCFASSVSARSAAGPSCEYSITEYGFSSDTAVSLLRLTPKVRRSTRRIDSRRPLPVPPTFCGATHRCRCHPSLPVPPTSVLPTSVSAVANERRHCPPTPTVAQAARGLSGWQADGKPKAGLEDDHGRSFVRWHLRSNAATPCPATSGSNCADQSRNH